MFFLSRSLFGYTDTYLNLSQLPPLEFTLKVTLFLMPYILIGDSRRAFYFVISAGILFLWLIMARLLNNRPLFTLYTYSECLFILYIQALIAGIFNYRRYSISQYRPFPWRRSLRTRVRTLVCFARHIIPVIRIGNRDARNPCRSQAYVCACYAPQVYLVWLKWANGFCELRLRQSLKCWLCESGAVFSLLRIARIYTCEYVEETHYKVSITWGTSS